MQGRILVALVVACTSPGSSSQVPGEPSDDASPETSQPNTTDTAPTSECDPVDTMGIASVEVEAGPRSNQLEFHVELTEPGSAAVLCTGQPDPTEQHLVESTEDATSHTLRLSGLLATWTYTCRVAPTCPAMLDDAATFEIEVAPPPRTFPFPTVVEDAALGSTGAWTLLVKPLSGLNNWILVYDDLGRPRWWSELPGSLFDVEVLYDVETETVVWGGGQSPDGRVHVEHLWEGTRYTADVDGWQDDVFHHDGKRIADGRLLLLDTVSNSGPGSTWDGFRVRLVDPATTEVDFEIDSQRYVDEGHLRQAGGWLDTDPYHANWMDWRETAAGPVLYVSLCFAHKLIAIDGTNGELLWQLGPDLGWTVLDADGSPLDDSELPQCQHGPEIDGDRILFYDNAQERERSRAVEWEVDPDTQTARRLWLWEEDGWQEDFLGDIDYLPNGRVLVTQARFGFGTGTSIVEIVPETGEVASRMTFETAGAGYRAERYDGCDLFASVSHCGALQDRLAELAGVLE